MRSSGSGPILAAGREIVQETRLWDTAQNQTVSMRGKEEAHDYRYFPDPDLVPVQNRPGWLESLRKNLLELPDGAAAALPGGIWPAGIRRRGADPDKARADKFEATVKEFLTSRPSR